MILTFFSVISAPPWWTVPMHLTASILAAALLFAPSAAPVAVPAPTAKAIRYHREGDRLWVVGQVWSFAVPAALLLGGASARMRDLARRRLGRWPLVAAAYAATYLAATALVDLPLDYYRGFVRPHEFGLSVQPFGKWLGDLSKARGIGLLIACAFAWLPVGLIRASPRRWWLYLGLLALPALCVLTLLKPVFYDPIFHEFGPMKDPALERRILDLAARAGIRGGRVYEVGMAGDTTAVNAYVTGFGGTRRIVLWDTLLAKLSPAEVLAVMGHEMGHYALDHILRGIALSVVGAVFVLFLVHRAAGRLIARHGPRLGIESPWDVAAVPLYAILIHAAALLTAPVALAFSRHQEHEADRFALEMTRDNRAAATAFVALQRENLSIPYLGPLAKAWRASHPSIGERIEFCNAYRPWERGEPGRYGRYFAGGGRGEGSPRKHKGVSE